MQTIEMAMRSLLPYGSNGKLSKDFKAALLDSNSGEDDPDAYFDFAAKKDFKEHWGELPMSPLDVFAVSAFITKRTGAYTFVMPGLPATQGRTEKETTSSDPFGLFGQAAERREKHQEIARLWRYGLILDYPKNETFILAAETDQYLDRAGKAHIQAAFNDAALGKAAMAHLQGLWEQLIGMGRQKLVLPIGPWEHLESLPHRLSLFKTILQLMVIADEASAGVSEYQTSGEPQPWLTLAINEQRRQVLDKIQEDSVSVTDASPVHQPSESFVFAVDVNLAPVLPKSRTVSLGCSLRSLSRHVALGPISTEVKGSWIRQKRSDDTGPLNVLLIPFPDEIPFDTFNPAFQEHDLCKDTALKNWRWFDVDQDNYLMSRATDARAFLLQLDRFEDCITQASEGTQGGVNGVILPEMALNFDYFLQLAKRLIEDKDIEFLIAGTSDAPLHLLLENHNDQVPHTFTQVSRPEVTALKRGNYVATATFFGEGDDRFFSVRVQHKHHRWKLTRDQIINYGSAGCLDVSKDWWEKIRISNRSLNFWNFRKNSSFVSLICEDLARNDPAQQLIRSVGPSLVFAILMDGPQLPTRWPGSFAASLSVDPGSSVLTLTNIGLLKDRGNGGKYPSSRKIALWADAENPPRSISMGPNANAVLLTISPLTANTHSLDGRTGLNGSHKWILTGVKDV